MTSHKQTFQRFLLTALLCTGASLSMAQGGPAAAGGGHGMHSEGARQHEPAKMQARMADQMAAVKTKLQLTPAQEAAWTSFTRTVQTKPHAPMAAAHAELDKLPTPERIDRMRSLHTQRMADMGQQMDQRAAAVKTFYAVLTPAQQKVFDEQLSRTAGRHGDHNKGHGGHTGPMAHMGGT
jgi:hypothetical protein